MAEFTKMLPLIFHFAAGVYGKNGSDLMLPYEKQFNLARKNGWSDDPDDPGGATMIDVTLNTYAYYRKTKGIISTTKSDLRNISFPEWMEILKTMFWNRWRADEIQSQGIANMLVDWVWASGDKSIRNAQKVIGVTADGIVGAKTLSAVNNAPTEELFYMLRNAREKYYRNCRASWKYLNGWLRRLNAILPNGSFKF